MNKFIIKNKEKKQIFLLGLIKYGSFIEIYPNLISTYCDNFLDTKFCSVINKFNMHIILTTDDILFYKLEGQDTFSMTLKSSFKKSLMDANVTKIVNNYLTHIGYY